MGDSRDPPGDMGLLTQTAEQPDGR
jgi:hypothetical protein